MALRPKSAVFQVRIDPALLVRFQVVCEMQHVTVSEYVRRMIMGSIAQHESRQESKNRKAAQLGRIT